LRVRETVPDSIFDRADAVELVDLTPQDLIERLKEGKVYVPKQAERALKHYFSPSNLTALREAGAAADRRPAVDGELLNEMQARAIRALGRRRALLVCISEDPRAAGLVRYAKRLADRLHAPFTALCVETRRSQQLSDEATRPASPTRCGLPRRVGGEGITIPGGDRGISGRRCELRARQQRHPDHHREIDPVALVRNPARLGRARSRSGAAAISAFTSSRARTSRASRSEEDGASRRGDHVPRSVALSGRAAGGGGRPWRQRGHSALLRHRERRPRVSGTAVVGVAVRYGSAVAAGDRRGLALLQTFSFMPPLYTFTIADPTNIAAFVFFTVVAVIVSILPRAGAPRPWPRINAFARWKLLTAFSRKLAGVGTLDDCPLGYRLPDRLDAEGAVVLLLPEDGMISVKAGYPPEEHSRRGRHRGRQMGMGQQPPAGAGRTPCRAPGACSSPCARAAARSG